MTFERQWTQYTVLELEGGTIIDGTALVNAIPPRIIKSIDDYAKEDILPKVESYGAKYELVDIVFDVYKKLSLKSERRFKRSEGKNDRNF